MAPRLIKSPYPEPPPPQDLNAHYALFHRPDQAQWPKDFALHIDAESGKRVMYREFLANVNDLATAIGGSTAQGCLGIGKPNEKIGIIMENSTEYTNIIHSSLVTGVPFVLISSYSTPFELKHALTLSQCTHVFVDAKFLPKLLPVAQEIGLNTDNIYIGVGSAPSGRRNVADLIAHVRAKAIPFVGVKPVKKDHLAYLVFSSGTSGLPKAVMISHGNLIYSLGQAAIVGMVSLAATGETAPAPHPTPEGIPVVLSFLPMHHTYGLHTFNFRAFLTPYTFVFLRQWDIDLALDSVPKYKVSVMALIPSIVHQLVYHPRTPKTDWSTIRILGSGAAYLPPELADKLAAMMPVEVTFSEGYGMSEGTLAAIGQPTPGTLGKYTKIPGCTGILLPGLTARILRDDGTDADVDEPGELWLKGDTIALGYYNNEKANKESFRDGWLVTGDRFRADKDGNFWFADRAKDTLKVSGAQVSPVEIEGCILEHPDKLIIDVTVAGVSGHGRTSDEKVPRAWIVLSEKGQKLGKEKTIKALDKWVKKSLSKYKWVRGGFEVVDTIPKSPTGKVLRRVLVDEYEDRLKSKGKKPKAKL